MRFNVVVIAAGLFFSFLTIESAISDAAPAQSYSEVKAFINRVHAQNPSRTTLFDIGMSDSGEVIQGIKIGNGTVKNLVVGTHHGNEYGATEVALGFAESIAKNPIAGQTVFVIPVLNITGYNHRDRYELSHDPNRDYPGPCGTEGPFKLKSTKALADFVAREKIVASATLHTYYPAVVYPWGFATHDLKTPYQDLFIQMTKDATQESGYQVGNSSEVIYPAGGTFEDYAFWHEGIWSILFELGNTHSPNDTDVDTMVAVNVPGIRRMLANAPKVRATDHAFNGTCDPEMRGRDKHNE